MRVALILCVLVRQRLCRFRRPGPERSTDRKPLQDLGQFSQLEKDRIKRAEAEQRRRDAEARRAQSTANPPATPYELNLPSGFGQPLPEAAGQYPSDDPSRGRSTFATAKSPTMRGNSAGSRPTMVASSRNSASPPLATPPSEPHCRVSTKFPRPVTEFLIASKTPTRSRPSKTPTVLLDRRYRQVAFQSPLHRRAQRFMHRVGARVRYRLHQHARTTRIRAPVRSSRTARRDDYCFGVHPSIGRRSGIVGARARPMPPTHPRREALSATACQCRPASPRHALRRMRRPVQRFRHTMASLQRAGLCARQSLLESQAGSNQRMRRPSLWIALDARASFDGRSRRNRPVAIAFNLNAISQSLSFFALVKLPPQEQSRVLNAMRDLTRLAAQLQSRSAANAPRRELRDMFADFDRTWCSIQPQLGDVPAVRTGLIAETERGCRQLRDIFGISGDYIATVPLTALVGTAGRPGGSQRSARPHHQQLRPIPAAIVLPTSRRRRRAEASFDTAAKSTS